VISEGPGTPSVGLKIDRRGRLFVSGGAAGDARVVERLTDARFDVPTTVAAFGHRLYLPNARFTTPPTPTTQYTANAIRPH
jgi:hypothetical protein